MSRKSSSAYQNLFSANAGRKIIARWYLLLPAILLFVYIIIRANVLALTWDEANTFFEYVRNPRWFTQDYNYIAANNHLLNTWLMKISVSCFGEREFALRLPNVLAGGVYLVAAILLAEKMFEKKWMIFSAFVILCFNPYLLDFFSTARGYGISMALLLCAILQLARYVMEMHEVKRGIYAQLLLAAAVLANLTMIYLLLGMSLLLVFNRFIFHKEKNLVRHSFLLTIIPVIVLAFLIPYQHKLQNAGALFLGAENKSVADTFLSLAQGSLYDTAYAKWFVPLMTILFSAIPLFSVLLVGRNISSLRDKKGRWMVMITLLLLICTAAPAVQHFILKTNYLSGRTALFYLPLGALNFLCLIFFFPEKFRNISLGIAALFSFTHFLFAHNLHSFYDWKEQADVKEMMLALKNEKGLLTENIYANTIAVDLPYEKQINYYRMRFAMDNLSHTERDEHVSACSYFYLNNKEVPGKFHNKIYEIGSWFSSQTTLIKPESQKLKYLTEVWQDFEHEYPFPQLRTDSIFLGNKGTFAGGKYPYSCQVAINVPDSVKENIVATLNCRLLYHTRNTSALLVFCFDDGNNKAWAAMHITELSVKPGEWSITNWTRPVPAGTKQVRIYLWNRDENEVLMDNVALRLLTY